MIRRMIFMQAFLVFLTSCGAFSSSTQVESCQVTTPAQQTSILPIDIKYEGSFWYGTPALWTNLPVAGTWSALPRDKTGFVQKTVFWREGFDAISEPQPALTVSGRRLDAEAPTFAFSDATHGFDETGNFMLMGISIPTEGCWGITAEYQEASLSYIVLVAP